MSLLRAPVKLRVLKELDDSNRGRRDEDRQCSEAGIERVKLLGTSPPGFDALEGETQDQLSVCVPIVLSHWSHGDSSPEVVLYWNRADRPLRHLPNRGLLRRPDVHPGPKLHSGSGPPDAQRAPVKEPAERIVCDKRNRLLVETSGRTKLFAGWTCWTLAMDQETSTTGDKNYWFHR